LGWEWVVEKSRKLFGVWKAIQNGADRVWLSRIKITCIIRKILYFYIKYKKTIINKISQNLIFYLNDSNYIIIYNLVLRDRNFILHWFLLKHL